MAGYREDNFDPEAAEAKVPKQKGRWKWVVGAIAYMIPFFWLKSETSFPESFGVPACRGRGCMIEDWYHSYLLVERHSVLDVVTFIYMWTPIVAFIVWRVTPKLRGTKFSLYDDQPTAAVRPAPLSSTSVFDAEDAGDRRRTLILVAIAIAVGALIVLIPYFKGAH